jgi:hypothetical protein
VWARLSLIAWIGLVAGGCAFWSMAHGYVRVPPSWTDAAFIVSGVAFMFGLAYALLDSGWTWFRTNFPTRDARALFAQSATRLGLRAVEDRAPTLDRLFPLLGAAPWTPAPATPWRVVRNVLALIAFTAWLLVVLVYGTATFIGALTSTQAVLILGGASVVLLGGAVALTGWPAAVVHRVRSGESAKRQRPGAFTIGALRPGRGAIRRLAVGKWNEIDVRAFDYEYGDPATELTCCIVELEATAPDMEIRSESLATRLAAVFHRASVSFDQEEFDHRFRVLADDDDAARRFLNVTARARLLSDTVSECVQFRGRQMLYCVARLPIGERSAMLQSAKRLRDALSR